MSEHTPGPWHTKLDPYSPTRQWLIYAEHDDEFEAYLVRVVGSQDEANANLIAAAPDLLAVLEAQGHGSWLQISNSRTPKHCLTCKKPYPCPAAQAIAKAKGENR